MPKVFSAQAAIEELNPHVEVRPYNRALTGDIAEELFAEYDLILDGTDSYETRALVNRAAVAVGRPVLAGAISAWEGQVTLYDPASGAPCMACVFPNAPAPGHGRDLCRDGCDRRPAGGRRLDDGAGGGEACHRRGDGARGADADL
jgi:molybdopterin/thiamine biosynthesis adenylyltransferase